MHGINLRGHKTITSSKEFAKLVMTKVRQARSEILIDTFTLEFDSFGQALLSELEYSCQRGIFVCCLIDASGSQNFINDHPALFTNLETQIRIQHLRKSQDNYIIFDRETAVVGSHNLCEHNPHAGSAEEYASCIITGAAVEEAAELFDSAWQEASQYKDELSKQLED